MSSSCLYPTKQAHLLKLDGSWEIPDRIDLIGHWRAPKRASTRAGINAGRHSKVTINRLELMLAGSRQSLAVGLVARNWTSKLISGRIELAMGRFVIGQLQMQGHSILMDSGFNGCPVRDCEGHQFQMASDGCVRRFDEHFDDVAERRSAKDRARPTIGAIA